MIPLGILAVAGAANGGGAAYELISTTLVSSEVSTVSMSSIPSTYKHLEIRIAMLAGANGGGLAMQFNGDTASNYAKHGLLAYNSSALSVNAYNRSSVNVSSYNVGANTIYPSGVVMSILDYASTTKFKTTRSAWGIAGNSGTSGENGVWSGLWRSTSAITSFTILSGGGNFASGSRISLYGIRG